MDSPYNKILGDFSTMKQKNGETSFCLSELELFIREQDRDETLTNHDFLTTINLLSERGLEPEQKVRRRFSEFFRKISPSGDYFKMTGVLYFFLLCSTMTLFFSGFNSGVILFKRCHKSDTKLISIQCQSARLKLASLINEYQREDNNPLTGKNTIIDEKLINNLFRHHHDRHSNDPETREMSTPSLCPEKGILKLTKWRGTFIRKDSVTNKRRRITLNPEIKCSLHRTPYKD